MGTSSTSSVQTRERADLFHSSDEQLIALLRHPTAYESARAVLADRVERLRQRGRLRESGELLTSAVRAHMSGGTWL